MCTIASSAHATQWELTEECRLGIVSAEDIEYRGMYCAMVGKKVWLPQHVIEEHFRGLKNEVGSGI